MKVGDLVRQKRNSPSFNKVFIVRGFAEMKHVGWIKVLGRAGWHRIADFEVVNESR